MDLHRGEMMLNNAQITIPLLEQRDGSYQINLVDMERPPKVKDQEVEVLQAGE